ncbi:MAG: heat-inducible transcriptional repressor HrcA [Gammaproteobacteria bacterium]|nr:heat-inducible transcriptional repressor HrcA [Gammaproteobacteria bacterium]
MSKNPSNPVINERAQHLLRVLIERYIRDGEPVGSRTLARDAAMELSSATIRNVMADLEDMGFVKSPHTSAGRMPTVQGYRFFVDSLLTVQPLDGVDMQRLRAELNLDLTRQDLVERASNLLSGITRMAGVVMLPRRKQAALRRIDFLPLSDKRVLVIMVINEREVQNRIIYTDRKYTQSELELAANFLNEQFGGKDIAAVRDVIVADLQQTHEDMNRMMKAAVEMAGQVFQADDMQEREDVVVAGQTNLMGFRELCEVDTLHHLFEAFNQKREILHLLDQCVNAEGVQIFIGEESGYTALDECSVVTSPYSVDGKVVGVLGVIGPTRMAYDRVIPIVDTTARLLGAALNPRE